MKKESAFFLMKRLVAIGTAATVAFVLALSSPSHAAGKIRVTIPAPGTVFMPIFWAVDKGVFAKHGLEAEIVMTGGDGPDVDALIAGSVQFSVTTPNRLLTAYQKGKPLLAVMSVSNNSAMRPYRHFLMPDYCWRPRAAQLNRSFRFTHSFTLGANMIN